MSELPKAAVQDVAILLNQMPVPWKSLSEQQREYYTAKAEMLLLAGLQRLRRHISSMPDPPDAALGRCQALLQCHRETGHAGGHEAREEWDREHGIVRTDRRTPDDAVIGYRCRIDGVEYLLHPSDVDIVRPVPVGAQGEATDG
jgi:hypothetical protein